MRRFLAIASMLLALALPGQGAPPQAKPGAPLEAQITSTIGVETGRWGILAVDLAGGRTVFAHNPDALFVPASNQKVFTTAAALDALGPYWTTRTSVYAGARPGPDGVLRGDLVLYGRGDPNLSGRFSPGDPLGPLRLFATRLRDAGVRRVEGGLVADDSYLSGPPYGAGWTLADLQRPFGAEVSALSFNDNLASVYVTPGARGGDPCTVRLVPDVGYVAVVNEITTVAGGRTRVRLRRDLDANRIDLGGALQAGAREWGVTVGVREPALYTAAAFRRALADAGIEIAGPTRRLGPTSRRPPELELDRLTELASVESLPLSELVHIVNKESQNLHAELLLRLLGHERGPSDLPSDEAGLAVVVGFLERVGASAPGMRLHDGSGLSRLDRISPRMLERVLASLDRHPSAAYFWDSLPDAGVDGTLRHRLGKVSLRAKTGSLENAKSLSGYLATASGERLAISIVYNDPSGTGDGVPKINRVVTALAGHDARRDAKAEPRGAATSRESSRTPR